MTAEPWPHPWPVTEHCWFHNAHEPEPESGDSGEHIICPECWHLFPTADALLAAHNVMIDELNQCREWPGADPAFEPSDPVPHETDAAKIFACPLCAHDF